MSAKAGRRQDEDDDEDFETPIVKDKDKKKRKKDRRRAQNEDDDQPYNSDFEHGVKDKKKRKKDRRQAREEDEVEDDDDDFEQSVQRRSNKKMRREDAKESAKENAQENTKVNRKPIQPAAAPFTSPPPPPFKAPAPFALPAAAPIALLSPPAPPPKVLRTPSVQQQTVISLARAPNPVTARVTRVIAAAGAGKTTTIDMKCQELRVSGHLPSEIYYLVYNKVAARDASERMGPGVHISTLHSCAFNVLGVRSWVGGQLMDEEDIDDLVRRNCEGALDEFLKGVKFKKKGKLEKARGLICYYIRKTLSLFMRSSRDESNGFDPKTFGEKCYYPALLYHAGKKEQDLPRALLKEEGVVKAFYLGQAAKIWREFFLPPASGHPPRYTFDSITKLVQLGQFRIPCSVLMVDESQDLSECQIDWLHKQCSVHNTDVTFVGDPGQAIYSFNGAKPKSILNMHLRGDAPRPAVHDCPLTLSFRFGAAIACVANLILFAKFMSPQSLKQHTYTVVGGGAPGEVTTRDLVSEVHGPNGVRQPVTVISRSNMGLLSFVINTMFPQGHTDEDYDDYEEQQEPRVPIKFCVLGDGLSSGKGKFKALRKTFDALYRVYLGESKVLRMHPWTHDDNVKWADVMIDADNFELTEVLACIKFIGNNGRKAPARFDYFEDEVINANYSQEEADVILTTVHQAKGLEWDRVQVLNDCFADLHTVKLAVPEDDVELVPSFDFCKNGDEVNLWYVAVTRPRFLLSVPRKFMALVKGLEKLRIAGEAILAPPAPPAPPVHAPVTPPGSPAPAPVPVPVPVLVPVPAAPAKAVKLLGSARSPKHMKVLYQKLYVPLRRVQRGAGQGGGLVIDGVSYFGPGP